MSAKIVLVGCGNMGYALLERWLRSDQLTAGELLVVEPADTLRTRVNYLGVTAYAEATQITDVVPKLVVFAVKPQIILDVVPDYIRFGRCATYLSISAGTTISALEGILGDYAAIVRCMPNTPAAIGKGMTVMVANGKVGAETQRFIVELLSVNGKVAFLEDEVLMDAATAISGSGPAYVLYFIECLTAAGEAAGLPLETAKLLAMQTVYGAASLAAQSGEDPSELRRQVTSPNGTTAAALSIFMSEARLKRLINEAVDAARLRSIDLNSRLGV